MSLEILDKLEALDKAASAGPWKTGPIGVDGPSNLLVADCDNQCPTRNTLAPDIELIALMRNALPALLKVVRAAEIFSDSFLTDKAYDGATALRKALEELENEP